MAEFEARSRFGWSWIAIAALVPAILAGHLSAISLGGQSGKLLWADAVLAIALVIGLLRHRLRLRMELPAALRLMVPFMAWSALSLLAARDVLTGIAELKEWMFAWCAGCLGAVFAVDRRRARALLGVVALAGALVALHMAWVAWHHPMGPVLAVLLKSVDLTWGRTNYLAGILILALPVAIGLMSGSGSGRACFAALAAVIACSVGLGLSASKGAIVSLVAALLIAYAPVARRSWRVAAGLTASIAAGALAFTVGPLRQAFEYRLQQSAIDYSVGERMDLYRLAWSEFLRHPVIGIGLNNFAVSAHRLTGVDTVPHNFVLGFLAELGIIGVLLALAVFGSMLVDAWRARASTSTAVDLGLGLGLWAAFLAAALHNLVESTVYGEQYKILIVLCAVASSRLAAGANDPTGSAPA